MSEIDEKARDTARGAYRQEMENENGWRSAVDAAIRAYLAASPSAAQPVALQRIRERISVFASTEPEEDEDWQSWYLAAFDLLGAEVDKIAEMVQSPPPPAASEQMREAVEAEREACAAIADASADDDRRKINNADPATSVGKTSLLTLYVGGESAAKVIASTIRARAALSSIPAKGEKA